MTSHHSATARQKINFKKHVLLLQCLSFSHPVQQDNAWSILFSCPLESLTIKISLFFFFPNHLLTVYQEVLSDSVLSPGRQKSLSRIHQVTQQLVPPLHQDCIMIREGGRLQRGVNEEENSVITMLQLYWPRTLTAFVSLVYSVKQSVQFWLASPSV